MAKRKHGLKGYKHTKKHNKRISEGLKRYHSRRRRGNLKNLTRIRRPRKYHRINRSELKSLTRERRPRIIHRIKRSELKNLTRERRPKKYRRYAKGYEFMEKNWNPWK
jgi:hypothetical protein